MRIKRSAQIGRGMRPRVSALNIAILLAASVAALTMPVTVACQRQRPGPEAGIEELRTLVAGTSGSVIQPQELIRFEARYPRSRAAALARFLRGYTAYNQKDYKSAVAALDNSEIENATSIGDYARFFQAESEAAQGENKQALRDYQELLAKHTESLKVREARLAAARSEIAVGNTSGAIAGIKELADNNDADALYITGQAFEASGNSGEALRLYTQVYYELPATTAAASAESRLEALGKSPKTNLAGYAEELARCDRIFEAKQYFDAAAAYEKLFVGFPDRRASDAVSLRYGASLLNNKQPAQAATELAKVTDQNPETHAEALSLIAEALRKSNRIAQSGAAVDRLIAKYPRTRWAQDSLFALASALKKDDRQIEAAERYHQVLSLYPRTSDAAEASYMLGWQAYQSKRYADAARILEQHLATYRYPESKFIGESGLWAGKSEERLGKKARALALYELVSQRYTFGYHGYIAAGRAARLRAADSLLRAEEAKPGSDLEKIKQNVLLVGAVRETADGSEAPRIGKADDLEVIGLYDLAVRELNAALEKAPGSPSLNMRLALLYSRQGETFQATLVLRRGYPDIYSYRENDIPREAWEIFFPLNNWDTIKKEARRYGIDPYSAAGLIRQESVFNPSAVSRAGARGLMQVMPATGQLISKRQGSGTISAADLFNPTLNIKLGMSYLAQLLEQFGRIEYAAAAYNAGPGRAQRWIAERGSMDIEDWIESIPFSETRGYVQGVLRYTANYRRLYKE